MIGTKFYKNALETQEQLDAYSQAAEWCNTTQQGYIEDKGEYFEVVAIVVTLNEVKANKIAELKSIRDTKEVEDIEVGGHLFDYDDKARERINAAIVALDVTQGTIMWTLADNTDVEVSANDLRHVIAMVAQRSNVLHVKYRTLKNQVENAQTIEEVENIVWQHEE